MPLDVYLLQVLTAMLEWNILIRQHRPQQDNTTMFVVLIEVFGRRAFAWLDFMLSDSSRVRADTRMLILTVLVAVLDTAYIVAWICAPGVRSEVEQLSRAMSTYARLLCGSGHNLTSKVLEWMDWRSKSQPNAPDPRLLLKALLNQDSSLNTMVEFLQLKFDPNNALEVQKQLVSLIPPQQNEIDEKYTAESSLFDAFDALDIVSFLSFKQKSLKSMGFPNLETFRKFKFASILTIHVHGRIMRYYRRLFLGHFLHETGFGLKSVSHIIPLSGFLCSLFTEFCCSLKTMIEKTSLAFDGVEGGPSVEFIFSFSYVLSTRALCAFLRGMEAHPEALRGLDPTSSFGHANLLSSDFSKWLETRAVELPSLSSTCLERLRQAAQRTKELDTELDFEECMMMEPDP